MVIVVVVVVVVVASNRCSNISFSIVAFLEEVSSAPWKTVRGKKKKEEIKIKMASHLARGFVQDTILPKTERLQDISFLFFFYCFFVLFYHSISRVKRTK
jgi:hypothetical protein